MTALVFAMKIGSLDVVKLATGREKYLFAMSIIVIYSMGPKY